MYKFAENIYNWFITLAQPIQVVVGVIFTVFLLVFLEFLF